MHDRHKIRSGDTGEDGIACKIVFNAARIEEDAKRQQSAEETGSYAAGPAPFFRAALELAEITECDESEHDAGSWNGNVFYHSRLPPVFDDFIILEKMK